MKKFGFLMTLCLFAFAACKQDGASTTATEPSVPSAQANVNEVKPVDNPKADPAVPVGPLTTIEFAETEHDFGTVAEGEKVTHVYKFTNTGEEPLIISNAKATCGCTVPQWPREPIAPGASDEIKVQFDTKNKGKVGGGLQSKRVTITANTDPVNSYVTIKGKVERTQEAQDKKDAEKAAKAAQNPS